MSGGIDSSASLLILKEQGFEVIGVHFIMYEHKKGTEAYEKQQKDIKDAQNLAEFMGIQFKIVSLVEEFEKEIIQYFISEYAEGRTPNPCMVCNRKVKMKYLLEEAKKENAYYIATGHYAGIEEREGFGKVLIKGEDDKKDQSYFLANVQKEILPHIIFPLAKFQNKDEVREKYNEIYIKIRKGKEQEESQEEKQKTKENTQETLKTKKESQDICFIKNMDYKEFILNYIKDNENKKEDIVEKIKNLKDVKIYFENRCIAKGDKIYSYTIGKRKGLNIALNKKVYVSKVDAKKNEIHLGDKEDLNTKKVYIDNINILIDEDKFKDILKKQEQEIQLTVKLNYNAKITECSFEVGKGKGKEKGIITFKDNVRKPSKGQYAVIYLDDIILCSGVIS